MKITNLNLRKRLNITKYMEADTGVGEGAEGVVETNEQETNVETNEVKTFTQDQVEEMIKDRLARETKKLEKQYADKLQQGIKDGMTREQKLALMSDKEKEEFLFREEKAKFEADKKEYNTNVRRTNAVSKFIEAGFTNEQSQEMVKLLNCESDESVTQSMETVIKIVNSVMDMQWNTKKETKTKLVENSKGGTAQGDWELVLSGSMSYADYKKAHPRGI